MPIQLRIYFMWSDAPPATFHGQSGIEKVAKNGVAY